MTGNPPIGRTVIDQATRANLYLHFAIQLAEGNEAATVGDETLRLVSFSGRDAISDHFQYQLELHGDSDPAKTATPNLALRFDQLIGRPITVGINLPGKAGADGLPVAETPYSSQQSSRLFLDAVTGQWPDDSDQPPEELFTFFNGIVAAFAMSEPGVYQLTMRPALWRATLTNHYHIHAQRNIRDAIEGVLKNHHVDYSLDAVSGDDNPAIYRVQDWLQAGESDYDLVNRLMSKAHIYYYYRHGPTRHTLFFANRPDYAAVYADGHRLRYAFSSADPLGLEQEDVITQYRFEQTLTSDGVRGVVSRQQPAWEEDSVANSHSYDDTRDMQADETTPKSLRLPFNRFQIFQYGGSDNEVGWETQRTANRLKSSSVNLSGASHCARFRAGYQFGMADAASPGVNPTQIRPTLPEQPFVLTQVEHKAELDGGYTNQFQATETTGLVTPFSPQDTQQGSVLATVVKAPKNGVPPDGWKYYYKTNFIPDQSRLTDKQSPHYPDDPDEFHPQGVYVRFTTGADAAVVGAAAPAGDDAEQLQPPVYWVKLAPHMQTAPEIGVTVIVSRSYYADELPEIQSIVQNNGNKTVTPSGWTASTSVGSNYGTSYGDSKSNRFGLDSACPPGVATTFSGMDHPADEFRDTSYTAQSGAPSGDQNSLLDTAVKIIEGEYATGQFRDTSYSQGASYSFSTAEQGKPGILSRSDSFGSTYSHHEGAESKSYAEIDYSYSKSVMVNVDSYTTIDQKSFSDTKIGESESISEVVHNSTNTSTVKGDSKNTSTVNGRSDNYSTVDGLSYSDTKLNGGSENHSKVTGDSKNYSDVTGQSYNKSSSGTAVNISSVGSQSGTTTVGAQAHATAIGAQANATAIGATANANAVGAAADVSITAAAANLSLKGVIANADITGTGIAYQNDSGVLKLGNKGTDIEMIMTIEIIM